MIKINGEIWRVRLVSSYHPMLVMPNGHFALGCCDDITKTIYISNTLSKEKMKKVLCHEIVHASMYSHDVNITDDIEEIVADLFSTFGQEIVTLSNLTYDNILGWYI